ncbi:MAG TPA: carbon-nitrogen hydrolase family protein [Hyphomicrobiaceae bacterium]|nr:carbon-nitrogen hydrolase family protein [Hyphomicrobiaceae bacterium]
MTLSPERRFRAALVQLRSGRSMEANLERAEALVRRAAQGGAVYVQTPENTAVMELKPELVLRAAQTEDESVALAKLRALAAELGIFLHIGSLAIKVDEARVANRSYLIDPQGGIAARYDKLHMFDVDLAGGESHRESSHCRPGAKAVVADLPFGRLGLSVCYDLRFPQLYRALATSGAEFIAIPSAFTKQTGEAHWHVLTRARAIETGAFVLAATQGGLHENGRATYGHSLIVSPWGEILAEAGEEPGVIFADIDLAASAEARARIPALKAGREFEVEIVCAAPQAARREAS